MADPLLSDAEVMGAPPSRNLLSDAEVMGDGGRGGGVPVPGKKDVPDFIRPAVGANRAIAEMAGAPVDAATWVINHSPGTLLVNKGAEALGFKPPIPEIKDPVGGSESIKRAMGVVGANPDDVTPASTPTQHTLEAAGGGAAMMAVPGMALAAPAKMARSAQSLGVALGDILGAQTIDESISAFIGGTMGNLAVGAASGAGAHAAAEAAPEPYKPLAGVAGGLAAGVGAAGTLAAGRGAGAVTRDAVRAAIEPAEVRAARVIEARASEPGKFRQDLAEAVEEPPLVEGSQPTTFQATGDLGVGGYEREIAASPKGVPAFAARREEQNAARLEALGTVADPAADSAAVTDYVKSRLAALTDDHASNVATAARGVAESLARAGGDHFDNPAAYGDALRDPLAGMHQRAKDAASRLWRAIDPDMSTPVNSGPLEGFVTDLEAGIPKAARPPEGEEKAILDTIKGLGGEADFANMVALRSRLTDAMRDERAGGTPTVLRRLGMVLQGVDDTLAHTAGEIAEDPARRSDMIRNLQVEADAWLKTRKLNAGRSQTAEVAEAGRRVGAGDEGLGVPGQGAVPAAPRGQGEAGGQSGIPAGDQGAQAIGGHPPDVADRYAAARNATKEMKGLYESGPVGGVLASGPQYGSFKTTASNVAKNLFDSPERLQAFVDAAKGDPAALSAMQDYAAFSLRQAAVKDGMLSPSRLQKWMDDHGYALRQFPELAEKFADAKAAQTTMDTALGNQKQALIDFQTSAVKHVLGGTDPEVAVGKAMGNPEQFGSLVALVRGDPAALAGLKRAAADFMMSKAQSTAEAGTSGLPQINAATLQKFYLQNRSSLSKLFDADEMKAIESVTVDLQRANRSIAAVKVPGGSNTAQDTGGRGLSILQDVLQKYGGKAVGLAAGSTAGGPAGGAAGFLIGSAGDALMASRINNIEKAIVEMMLDPKMAQTWLAKVPAQSGEGTVAAFGRRLRTITANQVMREMDRETHQPGVPPAEQAVGVR